MHLELVQFLVRRELGVLVSVGPTEVGPRSRPKGDRSIMDTPASFWALSQSLPVSGPQEVNFWACSCMTGRARL